MKTMTKKEFQRFLRENEFKEYADIKSNGEHAIFYIDSCQANWSSIGYVYLWAEEDESSIRVVYVGKAGKKMKKRCNEHRGGFKGGSKTGKKHSDNILDGIARKKHYCVYARKSVTILDDEEQAFIQKLNPPWNTKKGKEQGITSTIQMCKTHRL